MKFRRPFGSWRVEPSPFSKSSHLPVFLSSFLLSSFLFSEPPTPGGKFTPTPPYPLLATSPLKSFAVMPSQNLPFSMPIFASIFDDILVAFCPKVPKLETKTGQNGFPNQSQNEAKTNMVNNQQTSAYHKKARRWNLKNHAPLRAPWTFTQIS